MNVFKEGDILLVGGNSWISRMIKKATKSDVNHAGMIISIKGIFYVIEAESRGIQLTPMNDPKYDNLNNQNKDFWLLRPKFVFNIDELTNLLPSRERSKYDYMGLLIWQPWMLLTGRWKGSTELRGTGKFYCSEFVTWAWNTLFPNLWQLWFETNPDDIKKGYDKKYYELIKVKK